MNTNKVYPFRSGRKDWTSGHGVCNLEESRSSLSNVTVLRSCNVPADEGALLKVGRAAVRLTALQCAA